MVVLVMLFGESLGCSEREGPGTGHDGGGVLDAGGGADAGSPADSGEPDAGSTADGGGTDAGDGDAGAHPDSGAPEDSGTTDAGPMDSGTADAGPADAGSSTDAGPADAGSSTDAGPPAVHTALVTSETLASTLGGLAGADTTCQSLAETAGLVGTYRAILSDSTTDARDRLAIRSEVRDTAGTLLATGPGELWGGSLRARLHRDENGATVTTSIIWTGTDADGTRDDAGGFCGNWTSGSGGAEAGRTDQSDHRWISIYGSGSSSGHACSNTSRMYCIRVE